MHQVQLQVLCRDLGNEYWKDYETLDQKFRAAVKIDKGDLFVGRQQLDKGLRVLILAYSAERPAGFVRLDLQTENPLIGDLYVEPEFQSEAVSLDRTPWLNNEANYRLWHFLVKAAYIVARRAGYQNIESYLRGPSCNRRRSWRDSQTKNWDAEADSKKEPNALLDLIKKQLPSETI